jgi:hypothetical protein
MTLCIVGFDDLVTSFVATIATGWSDPCRVGVPLGNRAFTRRTQLSGWKSPPLMILTLGAHCH